jgi:membrane-associated protease RseP (regulator of RpoE activity)
MDIYTLSVFAFIILLAFLVYTRRKRIEFHGILLLYRTKRFRNMIDTIAQKFPRLWKIVGTIGIIVAFYFMASGMLYLIESAMLIHSGEIKEATVKLVLPGVAPQTSIGYAYIFIPFWIWILTVFLILLPHELSHGIMARVERVRLKSVGLLLFLIFPGAFVEPDERQLERRKVISKLRIFAAGSFANIVVSILAFSLASSLWNPLVDGVMIEKVIENSPAEAAGIKPGMKLQAINGIPVSNGDFKVYSNFVLSGVKPEKVVAGLSVLQVLTNGTFRNYTFSPGDNITLTLDGKNYTITLSSHPEDPTKPFIGISTTLAGGGFDFLFPFLAVLSIISFAVAVINILPLYPLDGGRMIKALLESINKESADDITRMISIFTFVLLVYSFIGPVIRF